MAASDLAELVRGGEVSCREAIEAHLRRIEAVNPRVNAVAVPIAERGGFPQAVQIIGPRFRKDLCLAAAAAAEAAVPPLTPVEPR